MSDNSEIRLKIILLGDSTTKKTSFISRYFGGEELSQQTVTIGILIRHKSFYMRDMRIDLIIVETAGQERYRNIAMNFLKSAHGAILLYDITNISIFESLQKYYIKNIEEINPNIKYIIVGNNSDLENYRSISREEVRKYCEIKNVEELK